MLCHYFLEMSFRYASSTREKALNTYRLRFLFFYSYDLHPQMTHQAFDLSGSFPRPSGTLKQKWKFIIYLRHVIIKDFNVLTVPKLEPPIKISIIITANTTWKLIWKHFWYRINITNSNFKAKPLKIILHINTYNIYLDSYIKQHYICYTGVSRNKLCSGHF